MPSSTIVQLGFVVRDLRKAAEEWTRNYGVGPFFYMEHIERDGYRYQGRPSSPDISTALADWNGMQIQLVEQHNDEPSPHLDFLGERGPGLNHVAVIVPDYRAEIDRRTAGGESPISSAGGLAENVFYHPGNWDFPAVEMSNRAASPAVSRMYELVAAAAVDWDGSDPWRPMPPIGKDLAAQPDPDATGSTPSSGVANHD